MYINIYMYICIYIYMYRTELPTLYCAGMRGRGGNRRTCLFPPRNPEPETRNLVQYAWNLEPEPLEAWTRILEH